MKEFKEGDKVRVLGNAYILGGKQGVVSEHDGQHYQIKLDNKNGWVYFDEDELELVETKEKVVSERRLFKRTSESSGFFTEGLLYELTEDAGGFVESDTGSYHGVSYAFLEANFVEVSSEPNQNYNNVETRQYEYVGDDECFFTYGEVYEYDVASSHFLSDDDGDRHYFGTDLEDDFVPVYTNEEVIDRIEKVIAKNSDLFKEKMFEQELFGEFHAEEADLKASETQIAGNHYSKLRIQPMRYALENELNYGQANAVKYITRYKDKNGIEDLKKAIHCIELLIEFEEGES
jgi:hypothetical protein